MSTAPTCLLARAMAAVGSADSPTAVKTRTNTDRRKNAVLPWFETVHPQSSKLIWLNLHKAKCPEGNVAEGAYCWAKEEKLSRPQHLDVAADDRSAEDCGHKDRPEYKTRFGHTDPLEERLCRVEGGEKGEGNPSKEVGRTYQHQVDHFGHLAQTAAAAILFTFGHFDKSQMGRFYGPDLVTGFVVVWLRFSEWFVKLFWTSCPRDSYFLPLS